MRTIPAIGTTIHASVVFPGMIIDIDGEQFDVGEVHEGYDTWTFVNEGGYYAITVDYAAQVTVLGYFNPEIDD
jgi:hypothetical protein